MPQGAQPQWQSYPTCLLSSNHRHKLPIPAAIAAQSLKSSFIPSSLHRNSLPVEANCCAGADRSIPCYIHVVFIFCFIFLHIIELICIQVNIDESCYFGLYLTGNLTEINLVDVNKNLTVFINIDLCHFEWPSIVSSTAGKTSSYMSCMRLVFVLFFELLLLFNLQIY